VSTAQHYRANLRDLQFNLFEFLEVGQTTLGRGPFEAMDEATARESLAAIERLASGPIAASFAACDRDTPHIAEDGTVVLPEALKRSMAAFFDADWHRFELPPHLGGFGAPPTLVWAGFELLAGANPAVTYYLFAGAMARTLDRLATPAQKARYFPQMIDRRWGTAMVLTEPDAGSDVGAARTRAIHVGGDEWRIEGVKRFITNADYDATENVVHILLARPEGAAVGTKGLSMFIVPKFWVEADGTVGARNGWQVTRLEKKMGIRSSVTCEVHYGEEAPCRALLVGDRHDGIRQMFHIIEQARMAVGMKSMATLSTAYLNALAYTRERTQGPDLTRVMDKSAPRVKIVRHPDVRRMLMSQKAHAEAMRALCLFTAHVQDQVELLGGHGHRAADGLDALNDFLLPLVKGWCTDRAWEQLALSLQCLGGSGYCEDYPIEQYIRDQKIDTLYEGTTHIQALDLFLRKVARDGGATLQALQGRVRASLADELTAPALAEARGALEAALEALDGVFGAMLAKSAESLYHVGLQGNRVLFALADVVAGWLLLRHAAVALARREGASEDDRAFYDGKVASARWWAANVLPTVAQTRALIERSTLELMDLPDAAF
jgi:alkylation response protein AidB-like acyl-CoA dehydrogenase